MIQFCERTTLVRCRKIGCNSNSVMQTMLTGLCFIPIYVLHGFAELQPKHSRSPQHALEHRPFNPPRAASDKDFLHPYVKKVQQRQVYPRRTVPTVIGHAVSSILLLVTCYIEKIQDLQRLLPQNNVSSCNCFEWQRCAAWLELMCQLLRDVIKGLAGATNHTGPYMDSARVCQSPHGDLAY